MDDQLRPGDVEWLTEEELEADGDAEPLAYEARGSQWSRAVDALLGGLGFLAAGLGLALGAGYVLLLLFD